MSGADPAWSLTDDALVLILHAESDISQSRAPELTAPVMRRGRLGATMTDTLWLRETAVLRLISTVEAYTDAASEMFFTKKSMTPPKQPFSWKDRVKHYKKEHRIDLEARDGWNKVEAGIDLRNCLAHGLGNLTAMLLSEEALGKRMKHLDVDVHGRRMHLTMSTVPKLAEACRRYVLDVEHELVASL